MPRLSKLIEKLEDWLEPHVGPWYERHKKRLPLYITGGLVGWYFYGMLLNSIKLGTAATFHKSGEEVVESIWVFNPFRNWFVLFTPFGLGVTAVIVLLICLVTRKGFNWLSGNKLTHDARGFDITDEGTHGSSGFLTKKEMTGFLEVGPVSEVKGMMLGKIKKRPDDPDKYALYAAHRMVAGDNNNLLCIGAPGSGKSRGFIIPFLMGCAQRGESVFITDPKGELFEKLSPYFKEHGHYVKAVNFLDMTHSDGWNCLYGLDKEPQLAQTVANTIIQNTSGPREADDFWSRAELNLLMALIHYVVNLKNAKGNLLPIEQRGLGDVYQMLAHQSIQEINRTLAQLSPDHPAKGHHGLFLKAKENLWGSIAIGLGNRLATFDQTLYMGCNDMTSAEYISKKCGKVTISVTNSQKPLAPPFYPAFTSTRYSQTRSNTQRELMQPDEILRLDRRQCIAASASPCSRAGSRRCSTSWRRRSCRGTVR